MCREYKPTQFVKIMILQKLICCPDKIDIIIGNIQRSSYKDSYASY